MAWLCKSDRIREKCLQNFRRETCRKSQHFRDKKKMGVLLKCIVRGIYCKD
jgi:hypothetical protein